MHESAKKLATIAAETQRRENAVRTRGLIGRLLYLNPGLPPGPGQQQIVDHHTTAKPTHADHGIGGVSAVLWRTTPANRPACRRERRGARRANPRCGRTAASDRRAAPAARYRQPQLACRLETTGPNQRRCGGR